MGGRDNGALADNGDDRPGIDDLEGDDFSGLDLAPLRGADEGDDADDDDSDLDDEDDDDYPEDATDDDVDLVLALYREDGQASGMALNSQLANDFEGLIEQLRRVPGDAGALGVVSIDGDFFVMVRVRGRVVQVLLSDAVAANDWPIARDAADYLGVEIPDDEDDSEPVGDLDMFTDAGLTELEVESICSDVEAESLELVEAIVDKLGFRGAYDRVATAFDL